VPRVPEKERELLAESRRIDIADACTFGGDILNAERQGRVLISRQYRPDVATMLAFQAAHAFTVASNMQDQ